MDEESELDSAMANQPFINLRRQVPCILVSNSQPDKNDWFAFFIRDTKDRHEIEEHILKHFI